MVVREMTASPSLRGIISLMEVAGMIPFTLTVIQIVPVPSMEVAGMTSLMLPILRGIISSMEVAETTT
jgi:predicted transcriptional regulator